MGDFRVGTAGWTDKTLIDSGWYPPGASNPEKRLRCYAEVGLVGPGHAAVTAAAHHGRMCTGRRDPPERAGTLILRVWLEDSGDPTLRVRLVGRLNLDGDDQYTAAAASIDEALSCVRDWLERFAASGHG